ncbi:CHASE domain-containing protein [Adhaeribacter rhizoryzae]|uniref:histidine kinase n=1 Tax=Adhaeribacter rhizoryzae TaxID=2607907 RepID=A0A5M6CZI1_9BACT|nr:CHASE domain-containing protein [Adhaeribacter rhizoryzae]KAA5539820.1 PAS domain S-box protein [Adhaeribacter rhizoryzae]
MTDIKRLFKYFSFTFIPFLFFLGVTIFAYFYLKKRREEGVINRFNLKAAQAEDLVSRRTGHYIQVLKGAKGLFTASTEIERVEWKNYIEALEVYKNYPGIQGIGFAEVIRPENLQRHIRKVRAEGFPDYKLSPAGTRPVYTSIVYLEPFSGANLRAFGYDMFSEPIRRQAMEQARDSGQPVLSGKVTLVQESGNKKQPGFLLYLPVYQDVILPQTVPERRRLLKGYVYSPFRAVDLMQNVLFDDFEDFSIRIYDGLQTRKEYLLYTNNQDIEGSGNAVLTKSTRINMANRTWTIVFQAQPTFKQTQSKIPEIVLAAGSIISLLVFFALLSVARTRRANKLRQTISDNATVALFMLNAKGYCTFMNPMAERMTGYTFDEIQQQPFHYLVHHHYPNGSPFRIEECPIQIALRQNKGLRDHEDIFIRKDGTFFNVSCSATPVMEQDALVYMVLEVRDVTEERQAQLAILESEVRFRNMADSAPVMVWLNNEKALATYLNKQWLEFTGQTTEEALNLGWIKAVHPDDVAKIRPIYEQALKNQRGFEMDYRLRRHDGVYRWMATNAAPRFDAAGKFMGYIGSVIDITERKEAEQKIKENAQLLQKIFLEVPALVALIRAEDQTYVFANPFYRKMLGNQVATGKSIREAHPDLEGPGLFEQIGQVIANGKAFVGKEVAISKEANGKRQTGYFNLVYQPLFTPDREVEAVLIFAIEVTELVFSRKELMQTNEELSRTNVELRRTNTDLDNFVYTASHDLRAPIANLEGLTNDMMYNLYARLAPEEQFVLRLVQESINKLKRTIVDLTNITRVQKEVDQSQINLSFAEVLADVQQDILPMIEESEACIQTDFAVPEIIYARKNLRSILYNLVSNAIKYRHLERKPLVIISTAQEEEYITLTVSDNGLGIRADQQHKLFSMFRRVHTHVEGSGIGLYIVKRIVENNGGYVTVDSQEGQGATFKVFFKKQPAT